MSAVCRDHQRRPICRSARKPARLSNTAKLTRQVEIATAHVIGKQVEAGVGVGNGGEQSRI